MNVNKLSLIFIFTFLLASCSTDNPNLEDKLSSDTKNVSSTRAPDIDYVKLPANPIQMFVKYIDGTSENKKKMIRDRQKEFLGLVAYYKYNKREQVECTVCTGTANTGFTGDVEVWIVNQETYNEPCPTCRCCRSQSADNEEDDIERIQVGIIIPCSKQL